MQPTMAETAGSKLTSTECEQGRQCLEQARDGVIGATRGVSEAQWKFTPAADRWSIAQIVEHMVIVQELVLGPVRQQLANSPAAALDPDHEHIDAIVIQRFPQRTAKFKAPEILTPTGSWTPEAALDRLVKNHARLVENLESVPDLRRHRIESAPLKAVSNGVHTTMDGYQWVLAVASHTARHTQQILEVKADANFPAS